MITKIPIAIHEFYDDSERFIHFYNINYNVELALIQTGYQMPCHLNIKPKIRDHYLLHFVKHGSGCLYLQEATYHLEADDCFLIYPNEISSYGSEKESTWSYYWLGISGTRAEEFISLLGFRRDRQAIRFKHPAVFELLSQIVEAAFQYKDNSNGLDLMVNSLVRKLIFTLYSLQQDELNTYYPHPTFEDNSTLFGIGHSTDKYVNTTISMIQNNYGEDIRVDSIADYLHLNRSYLSSLFKRETNVSIKQYLLHCRIEAAKKLLTDTNRTITEISYQCGFQDPLYFSRLFKTQIGETPSNYRQQKKGLGLLLTP